MNSSSQSPFDSSDPASTPLPWDDSLDETAAESSAVDEAVFVSDAVDPIVEAHAAALDAQEAQADAEAESQPTPEKPPRRRDLGSLWTIPTLCVGLAILACCLIIPQADANRRQAYQRLKLQRDLDSLRHQIVVNDEFLKKVADDPTLAQRLAQRQLRVVPKGTRAAPLEGDESHSMSPYAILAVDPPAPLPEYQPVGGRLATLCYGVHSRLYLMGLGCAAVALGLVMGAVGERTDRV